LIAEIRTMLNGGTLEAIRASDGTVQYKASSLTA
jgi:hypothetical protein